MLMYIFWHWPLPETDLQAYERDERAFQAAIAGARPAGLIASGVFRCAHARWANDGDRAYEDCYLLQNSAALDVLNEIAVRGARKEPHDRLAHAMKAGTGGLYSLARGNPGAVPDGAAFWFAKPAGTRYEDLYARFEPSVLDAGATVWRRQMVLSPAPEFCAFGSGLETPLAALDPLTVPRQTVCACSVCSTDASIDKKEPSR